jgi:putative NADH-flavin reductase
MNVLLFSVTGNIGSSIARELLGRGHSVTGVTGSGSVSDLDDPHLVARVGDVTDAHSAAELAIAHDAVVSAIGPRRGSGEPQPLVATASALVEGLRRAGVKRVVIVGGAGSLEVAPGIQAVDTAGFPDLHKPNALAQRDALRYPDYAIGLVDELDQGNAVRRRMTIAF